jgi:hypothetical protein
MNMSNKIFFIIVLVFSFVSYVSGPVVTHAATAPSLGVLGTYGIVSGTYTNSLNTPPQTIVNGDRCDTTPPVTPPVTTTGTITTGGCDPATGTAQTAALGVLNGQACTSIGAAVDLNAIAIGANPAGTFPPGCYSSTGSMNIVTGTTVTLDATASGGVGNVWIFRSGDALTTGDNSLVVLANGANANNVFWVPVGATTLGANVALSLTPTFVGNIFRGVAAGLSITLGHFANLSGRTLAFGSTVTTDSNTISVPPATLRIIKNVINNNGGTATAASFSLHVKLSGVEVSGSPAAGAASPGTSYSLAAGTYVVSEDVNASYLQSFSGDCDASGNVILPADGDMTCTITNNDIVPELTVTKVVVNDNGRTKVISDFSLFVDGGAVTSGVANTISAGLHTVSETPDSVYATVISGDCAANGTVTLASGDIKFCVVTNNDIAVAVSGGGNTGLGSVIPPLIDVVKVPTPLALPNGPGSVIYTYTLRNIGTVPVTNVTMVGDSCSPVVLVSGDTNSNLILEVNETWIYSCTTTLFSTHTNTITATGWANGISAVDIASATVVVGVPVVPPLIHVTKVPSPLALSIGGGIVTYTNVVTNPGIVALSNIQLTDDKCIPVNYMSGDTNNDSMLDSNEAWLYTCRTNLFQTTTNTIVASGEANGLTARDFAIATVVVSIPGLPSTGFAATTIPSWRGMIFGGILIGLLSVCLVAQKKYAHKL